ncbi:loganic acid O-methyltransferase-like [Tripterygium wilfordii]|uniref:loganic acid O-methyltransferase-like n=1 Tax=Tripterygium wilfordii TaxID=458696 RepID=UPI0018F8282F|nr:loganic acid O-methyltransferase-like [Tripterygium wilfordii]XP_038709959.1 loganic acid O-methyltransferase-like [Tripterygium wilfordii]XP_038709960.1 loganic acid O-methyltransferase-like [Tripterygium wilfordii]
MEMETTVRASMNGGDGQYSYFRNSSGQRRGLEQVKDLINQGIAEKLDVIQLLSSCSPKRFVIADLGSSVGPNTFFAVQNILDSVQLKYQSYGTSHKVVEFQVFFNDQISNDFNTLFKNLPLDRQYFVAAVPGAFQGRLFPKSSLHFVHSSYAIHWLSKVPRDLLDKDSPAYNKGKVYYTNAPKEVFEAYSTQFAKDITSFLNARAQEVVHGGLMALLFMSLQDGVRCSPCNLDAVNDLLGATLMDMVKEGLVSEEKVDTFNLPLYNASPQELKVLIDKNACFSIERMETIVRDQGLSDAAAIKSMILLRYRSGWEGMLSEHFGKDIINDLFDRYAETVLDSGIFSESTSYKGAAELFLLLKRNDA